MQLVRYRNNDGGTGTAIIGDPGRKFTQYTVIEFPIRLRKMPNADVARYTTPIDAPLKRSIKRYLKIGRQHGISKGATKFLRGGLK